MACFTISDKSASPSKRKHWPESLLICNFICGCLSIAVRTSEQLFTVSKQLPVCTLTLTHSCTITLTVDPSLAKGARPITHGVKCKNMRSCSQSHNTQHTYTAHHPGRAARRDSGLHLLTSVHQSQLQHWTEPCWIMHAAHNFSKPAKTWYLCSRD